MSEQWQEIAGFPGYEISDLGKVRSWWNKGPQRTLRYEPKLIKLTPISNKSQYLRFTISVFNVKHSLRVHVTVLETFDRVGLPGEWALHRDGDCQNNIKENLYWGSPKQNAEDRTTHGNTRFGRQNNKAILFDHEAIKIRNMYASGRYTQQELANKFSVSQDVISRIVRGKIWTRAKNFDVIELYLQALGMA